MGQTQRTRWTLVLAAVLMLLSALMLADGSDAQDGAAPQVNLVCAAGDLVEDRCEIDLGPACPDEYSFDGERCYRLVDQRPLQCRIGSRAFEGRCVLLIAPEAVLDGLLVCDTGAVPVGGLPCGIPDGDVIETCPAGYLPDDSLPGLCARFEPAVQGPPRCPDAARGEPGNCYVLVARGPRPVTCPEGELTGLTCVIVGDPPVAGPSSCPVSADVFQDADECYRLVQAEPRGSCPAGSTLGADGCREPVDLVPGALRCAAGFGLVNTNCVRYVAPEREPAQCPANASEVEGQCRVSVADSPGAYFCDDPTAALNGAACVLVAPSGSACANPSAVIVFERCLIPVDPLPLSPCPARGDFPPDVWCAFPTLLDPSVCAADSSPVALGKCWNGAPSACAPANVSDGRCVRTTAALPYGSMRGTVRDLVSGQPVFGVQVCALRIFAAAETCTVTDRSGTFTLTGLEIGNHRLTTTDWTGRFAPGCLGMQPCDQAQLVGLGLEGILDNLTILIRPTRDFLTLPPTATPAPPDACPPGTFRLPDGSCAALPELSTPVPTPPATPPPIDATATPTPTPPLIDATVTPTASPTPVDGLCPPGFDIDTNGNCIPVPTPTPIAGDCPTDYFLWDDGLCYPVPHLTPPPVTATPTPAPVTPTPTSTPPLPTPTSTPVPMPGSVIAGHVVTGVDGLVPAIGVEVCAVPPRILGGPTCVTTDDLGAFAFLGLAPTNYLIEVDAGAACFGPNDSCDAPSLIGLAEGDQVVDIWIALPG